MSKIKTFFFDHDLWFTVARDSETIQFHVDEGLKNIVTIWLDKDEARKLANEILEAATEVGAENG